MPSARDRAAQEIVRQMEARFGRKVELGPEVRASIEARLEERGITADQPWSQTGCDPNDDQVCITCDKPKDICKICDWADCFSSDSWNQPPQP